MYEQLYSSMDYDRRRFIYNSWSGKRLFLNRSSERIEVQIIIYFGHLPSAFILFKDPPIDRHLNSYLTILFASRR